MSGKESFKVEEENQAAAPSTPHPASPNPPRALVQRLRGVLHAGHRFQTALGFFLVLFFSCGAKDFQIL